MKIEYDVTYWVVEALLSVTPNKPKWSTVNKVAVNGYDSLKENIQSYWEFQFWTDIIAWNKRDSAYKEFGKLISYPQKGQLRLVKVHVIKKTGVIITATMEIK